MPESRSRRVKRASAASIGAMLLLLSVAPPTSAEDWWYTYNVRCTSSTGYNIYIRSGTVGKTYHAVTPWSGGYTSWYKGFSAYPRTYTTNTRVQVALYAEVSTMDYQNIFGDIVTRSVFCGT